MIQILILSSLLCLGSAWNQPSTCYARPSSSCSSSSEIQELRSHFENNIDELRSYLETSLDSLTSTLALLVNDQDCQTPTTKPTPTTEPIPTTDPGPLIGTPQNPASSCSDISSDRPSGLYWIATEPSLSLIYCDTNRTSCSCNTTGGWMRVANLDMTNPNESCPNGFRTIIRNAPPIRTCGRSSFGNVACKSAIYPVHGIPYSRVCGRVKAYQEGSPNAFEPDSSFLDTAYVDGVSLTYGSPRSHIWTFAAAGDEFQGNQCPCLRSESDHLFNGTIPSFVGNNYFCDTGTRILLAFNFYSDDPLWDGAGCERANICCEFNSPPWFCRTLPHVTTDDIELRICADSGADVEDIAIEIVEIYVN